MPNYLGDRTKASPKEQITANAVNLPVWSCTKPSFGWRNGKVFLNLKHFCIPNQRLESRNVGVRINSGFRPSFWISLGQSSRMSLFPSTRTYHEYLLSQVDLLPVMYFSLNIQTLFWPGLASGGASVQKVTLWCVASIWQCSSSMCRLNIHLRKSDLWHNAIHLLLYQI